MPKNNMQPWELMIDAKLVLGMGLLKKIFQVGEKQLYRQMRNPDLDGDNARPVIDRVRVLLQNLHEVGGDETAHAILQFLALPAGYTCLPIEQGCPTCDDVRAECLEDYPTLVQLHEAVRDGQDMRAVQTLLDEHVDEVRQTVTLYEQEQGE
ncbi:hypothetical protein [Halodesulfovibrio sp. MK-HDV]|uniref:hypothetical protein n=1 Tax=Halodesulfovibrio sp. MK-HDV TaxID=2599925 RepID=UPI00136F4F00|nr:hypothetical protein [Halodesulfovibrio sp. MK-HDV]KAF1077633.1 hypothetical protein MKHDV_00089 [Halodesulfovibrio sp. MK-HDV]